MNLAPFALAAALAVAPFAAQAATLVYSASGSAFVEDSDPSNIFAGFIDLDRDDTQVVIEGSLVDGDADGILFVSDFGGTLLSGTLLSYEVSGGILTALFGGFDADDADAGRFGTTATAIFRFFPGSDDNGFYEDVTVEVFSDLAPVPLPASLPFLLAGIGLFAGARRLRS